MDSIYNGYFFTDFYKENGGGNYLEKENWEVMFGRIADKIIEIFNPANVLDAGCATGYLVKALRERGIEAYGFDISEFAINNVDESINKYCFVHSITEPLPNHVPHKFDLIVTIEVLEHLYPEDATEAIKNLCKYSDKIIFSSTPYDIEDKTHVNVQRIEYWARIFANQSLYKNLVIDMTFISEWCVIFEYRNDLSNIISEYEINCRILKESKDSISHKIQSKIYFDTGKGFNESETQTSNDVIKYNHISTHINVTGNTNAVRLEPVSTSQIALKNIEILLDNGDKANWYSNGFSVKNYLLFNSLKPEIVISEIPTGVNKIIINANILTIMDEEFFSFLTEARFIYDENLKLTDQFKQLDLMYKNLTVKMAETEMKMAETEMKMAETRNRNLLSRIKRKLLNYKRRGAGTLLFEAEEVNYNDSKFVIQGWIFDEVNTIKELKLFAVNKGNGIELPVDIGIKREDVKCAFKNVNAEFSGFKSETTIDSIKSFEIVARAKINDQIIEKRIAKVKPSFGSKYKKIKKKITKQNIRRGLFLIKKGEMSALGGTFNNISINAEENRIGIMKIIEKYTSKTMESWQTKKFDKVFVDIIIPVYNGKEYFDKLFSSIRNTGIKYRLIIVNDNSSDPNVQKMLEDIEKSYEDCVLINNKENLGFVKSINKGLSYCDNDVVILNTDIELPNCWLERMYYPTIENDNIASVTPFTNCGTICSFPNFCEDNNIFEDLDVNIINEEFNKIIYDFDEMPTGIGFCMLITKKAIEKIGILDEETFNKGYGEENDWCQRAIKNGMKNIQVNNLYVYHKHGGSFLDEEKKRLLEENRLKLITKHPAYEMDVAKYCKLDTQKELRKLLVMMLSTNQLKNGAVVYFNHELGGGASAYLSREIIKNKNSKQAIIVIKYDYKINRYKYDFYYKEYSFKYYFDNLNELSDIFEVMNVSEIVINELVTYPDLANALKTIANLKNKFSLKLKILGHDFYPLCPSINLLNDKGLYCELPEAEICKNCLNNYSELPYENRSIEKWRNMWYEFLVKCDEIVLFSNNSKLLYEQTYGTNLNYFLKPHEVNYFVEIKKTKKQTDTLNIGLFGILTKHKGLNVIKDMIRIIDSQNLDISIKLIGDCEEEILSNSFSKTGKYSSEELPKLILQNDIDVVLIPSVWPETFSYTTEEAIKLGLHVASFNIGAPSERISKYDKGIIINSISAEAVIKTILKNRNNIVKSTNNENKVLFLTEYRSFSSRYRVEHSIEELLLQGICSDFLDVPMVDINDLDKYSKLIIYRCRISTKLNKIIDEAHRLGIEVLYDIDDYIFDYSAIADLDFLKYSEYDNFEEYSLNIVKCMEKCDRFITSTNSLAKAINEKYNKEVIINRNVASLEMVTLSLIENSTKKTENENVVLGYFSGSKTHDKDFELISDIVLDILIKQPNTKLLIGGCLNLNDKFDVVKTQINSFEFTDWKKLPARIASIDINLMPLEENFFNTCKSENKWMEAALVSVPTIASYNSELSMVINDEIDGLLCRSLDEWKEKLVKMVTDNKSRKKLGQTANNEVIKNCITAELGELFKGELYK